MQDTDYGVPAYQRGYRQPVPWMVPKGLCWYKDWQIPLNLELYFGHAGAHPLLQIV